MECPVIGWNQSGTSKKTGHAENLTFFDENHLNKHPVKKLFFEFYFKPIGVEVKTLEMCPRNVSSCNCWLKISQKEPSP